jgi:hypothetical protein
VPVSPKRGAFARLRGEQDPARGRAAPGGAVDLAPISDYYACYVYQDRDALGWLLGRRLVESFTTALNPQDPYSVQAALAACVYRDQGPDTDEAVVLTYSIDVYEVDTDGMVGDSLVTDFRFSPWL